MTEIYSFHTSRPLNLWERCSLQSFADHGHRVSLYAYGELEAPDGVDVLSASEIVPDSVRDEFFRRYPAGATQFSDFFRYELLAQRGGWWVDTDVLCLAPDMPSDEVWVARRRRRVYVGIMRFPIAHPLMQTAAREARRRLYNLAKEPRTAIGPDLITALLDAGEYDVRVHDGQSCYKIESARAGDLGEPDLAEAIARELTGCPMVHWWGERFRGAGFPPHVLPPSGSYLARQFAMHGGAGAPCIALDEWRERVAEGYAIHKASKAERQAAPRTRLLRRFKRLIGRSNS
jgi:hypothetical protein